MDKFIQPVLYRHRLVDRESFSRRDFYVSFMQILTAAALILLTPWRKDRILVDPF